MARDEKLVYSTPIVVPLGDIASAVGAHCKSGTDPGAGSSGQALCISGSFARGNSAGTIPGCATGYVATGLRGPEECAVGDGVFY